MAVRGGAAMTRRKGEITQLAFPRGFVGRQSTRVRNSEIVWTFAAALSGAPRPYGVLERPRPGLERGPPCATSTGCGENEKEAAPYYQAQRVGLTMGPRSPATIRQPAVTGLLPQ